VTLTRRERDELHAAQLKVRQFKARERKDAKAKRPKSPKASRGRVRDNGYLAWLRRQPCVLGGAPTHTCEGATEACHIRAHKPGELPTGLQRKPDDRRATCLCAGGHREQHSMNEMRFWQAHGLNPFEVAERLYARYQSKEPG
jgi:hypothetical protein